MSRIMLPHSALHQANNKIIYVFLSVFYSESLTVTVTQPGTSSSYGKPDILFSTFCCVRDKQARLAGER